MIKAFIIGVLALSSASSEESFNQIYQDDFQHSGSLFTSQILNLKGDDSLNHGPDGNNVLNQYSINSLEHQDAGSEAKHDSYAQHSNSRSYDYLVPKESYFLPNSHFDHMIRDGLKITDKIPSLKLDHPYYRTPPRLLNQEYNYIPYEYGLPKNIYGEQAMKNRCIDCHHYDDEYNQNPTYYPHEKLPFNEKFQKNIYNPYLAHYPDYTLGQTHEKYMDSVEEEKQRLLDKIDNIYSYGKKMEYNKTTENSSNPREPLYKSDPHYFHHKLDDDESNYEYRIKSNGLFPYGPKHVDYYPERVNNYYESNHYNHMKEPQLETYYGHKDYSSDRYTPNYYSEEIIYPQYRYEVESSNTTNNETNTDRKVYYNPYFDFAPDAKIASGGNTSTNSTDLTAQVLKNLLDSKTKYPNSYYNPHANVFYNSDHKYFNNYAHIHGNHPLNYRNFANDNNLQHAKNRFYPNNIQYDNLYRNEHKNEYNTPYNYIPNRHFKEIVENVNDILHTHKYGPHEPYYKDVGYNKYKHLKDVLNVYSSEQEPEVNVHNDYYTENIENHYGQGDMSRRYKHFKDVVEEVRRLMQPKNKYNPYENIRATEFYHSRPHERHYGKLTQPFDKTNLGVLYPYKVRPNPYILPEYRRYQSHYHDRSQSNYNQH